MSADELAQAIEINKSQILGYFDETFSRNVVKEVSYFLKIYFRPEYIGFDELPERSNPDRPLIYASNHSGMAFPWDAIMFGTGLMEMHDFDMRKVFRPLAAPMLSASKLMNPYLLEDIWKRVGAIDATSLNFETMMNQEESDLLIYPEGVPGIGKGFNRKYQLQTFSTSIVRMAFKYETDIVSAFCINGEYINPYAYSSRRLNKLFNLIGIPFMPIGLLTVLMIFQPWLFYAALPAKLTYVRGKRYKVYEMIDKPFEEVSLKELRAIRDQLQAEMQAEMDAAVKAYGKKPYRLGEFFRAVGKNIRQFPYFTPIGWPALFTEFNRLYFKKNKPPHNITKGWFRFLRIIWHNPIVIAYFLPVIGWIPIIAKGITGRRKVKPWEGSNA